MLDTKVILYKIKSDPLLCRAAWRAGITAARQARVPLATLARLMCCERRMIGVSTRKKRPIKTVERPRRSANAILRALTHLSALAEYAEYKQIVDLIFLNISIKIGDKND